MKNQKTEGQIPDGRLNMIIENAWITLPGQIQAEVLRRSKVACMRVRGVNDNIKFIAETFRCVKMLDKLFAAATHPAFFQREITIRISGSTATLKGKVHSFFQKYEAGRLASNGPGIFSVANELAIEYN